MINILKTTILTLTLSILASIPVFAQDVNATVVSSDKYFITAEYNNTKYTFERANEDTDTWNKGDSIILDLESKDVHEALNGQYDAIVVQTYPEQNNLIVVRVDDNLYSFYADNNNSYNINDNLSLNFKNDEVINTTKLNNYNVEIQSISYIDNSITINKQGQLYTFYVDDPQNYYLAEEINITMDQNNSIVNAKVIDQPQVYNTTIESIQNNIATLSANNNKYTFETIEAQDGYKTGGKCKVIIQDGKLLEVRPIPLNER